MKLSEVKRQVSRLEDAKDIRKWLRKHKSSLSPLILSYVAFKMYIPTTKEEEHVDSVVQTFTGELFG